MTLEITLTPYELHGFRFGFPYDKDTIEHLKLCLGATWDKHLRAWVSEFPEVLLDMEEFRIPYRFGDRESERRAKDFLERVDRISQLKRQEHGVEGEQYSYQRIGTEILLEQLNGILGDDMGLGKTKQSIEAALKAGAVDILVVALNTTLYKWKAEVTKWFPKAMAFVIPTEADARSAALDVIQRERVTDVPRFIIVNYEKLWRPWWPKDKKWDMLIFDEATRVKNRKTSTAKVMKQIASNSLMTIAITGTPLETRPEELFGIFNIVRPSVFGEGITRFKEQHVKEEWSAEQGRMVMEFTNKDLLRRRFAPWLTRRTKAEVQSQLPPKLYTAVRFDLSHAEQEVYDQLADKADDWLGADDQLIQLLRFQQLTSSPFLVDRSDLGPGSKFAALLETIEPWEGRVLIFTRYKVMANYLSDWLPDQGHHHEAIITGDVKDPEERLRRLDAFNAGKLGKVFIGTDALSHGMDVSADLVIHYDKLWNPAKEWQREDRCHGVGRGIEGKVTNVVHLLANDTIDEGMHLVTEYRAAMIQEIIGEADAVAERQFSAIDYRSLIRGRMRE